MYLQYYCMSCHLAVNNFAFSYWCKQTNKQTHTHTHRKNLEEVNNHIKWTKRVQNSVWNFQNSWRLYVDRVVSQRAFLRLTWHANTKHVARMSHRISNCCLFSFLSLLPSVTSGSFQSGYSFLAWVTKGSLCEVVNETRGSSVGGIEATQSDK